MGGLFATEGAALVVVDTLVWALENYERALALSRQRKSAAATAGGRAAAIVAAAGGGNGASASADAADAAAAAVDDEFECAVAAAASACSAFGALALRAPPMARVRATQEDAVVYACALGVPALAAAAISGLVGAPLVEVRSNGAVNQE